MGKISQYGANEGIQCEKATDRRGGTLTDFGNTVSWRCTNGKYAQRISFVMIDLKEYNLEC